ncbi:MAG: poly-gamma-glutamate hydrolase family protein [Oligoflexia bacterium]|nr:poly-gamma-glutamate hydrolase family protein [Oligoflexia bacterium]
MKFLSFPFYILALASLASLALTSASAEQFDCFQGCSNSLKASTNCKENTDYTVTYSNPPLIMITTPVVIAIHGGSIELNTKEIALDVANSLKWASYIFDAHASSKCKGDQGNFWALHITSTKFNDERALTLLSRVNKAVSIHGMNGSELSVCVGGKDTLAKSSFSAYMKKNGDGSISILDKSSGVCAGKNGEEDNNIVNRTRNGLGLQLELSAGLRKLLVTNETKKILFRKAVKTAMEARFHIPPTHFIHDLPSSL